MARVLCAAVLAAVVTGCVTTPPEILVTADVASAVKQFELPPADVARVYFYYGGGLGSKVLIKLSGTISAEIAGESVLIAEHTFAVVDVPPGRYMVRGTYAAEGMAIVEVLGGRRSFIKTTVHRSTRAVFAQIDESNALPTIRGQQLSWSSTLPLEAIIPAGAPKGLPPDFFNGARDKIWSFCNDRDRNRRWDSSGCQVHQEEALRHFKSAAADQPSASQNARMFMRCAKTHTGKDGLTNWERAYACATSRGR